VTEALDDLGDVPMESIDVHAENGVVTIEGVVDDRSMASRVVGTAQTIRGVGRVVNNLRLAGVDTHIPTDD
jgi:Predicted periplasmic or secreted lipoprotein